MTTFSDLQVGYYNALATGLGFQSGYPFQMLQPSAPVVAGANQNALLWNYMNNIPPFSLTNNFIASGGAQFFSNYSGLLSALQSGANTFEDTVGPQCNAAWNAYVPSIPLTVPLSQFPQVFQRWAMTHGWTPVAQSGATALASSLLDPIFAAQTAMLNYVGAVPPKPADWDQGYNDLVAALKVAPAVSFTMDSATMNSSSSQTWAASSQSAFFGLWTTSSSSSSVSNTFAASHVTVKASFDHLTTFAPVPLSWYNSAAMGEAFANPNRAPWKSGNPITWQTTFDQSSGNLARFVTNLIVASGMSIVVQSDASFSQADQQEIRNNASAGLWPFYSQSSNSGVSTSASFDASGHLTVTISAPEPTPIVLGVTVLPAKAFVGHAVEGAKMHRAALRHEHA